MTGDSRRVLWGLFAVTGGGALLVIAAVLFVRHQPVDDRWQRCGLGDRGVTGLLADDGRLIAAANKLTSGDLWISEDRCTTFQPWGLRAEVVWSVARLERAGLLCAGARGRMVCQQEGGGRRTLVHQDVYWALETEAGVLVGGYPQVLLGDEQLGSLAVVAQPGYAAGGAARVGGRVFVGTRPLLYSDDGGLSFHEAALGRTSRVVAGIGSRVYVGGGTFGGFLARSDDLGESFSEVELPGSQPEVLLLPGEDPDLLLLGAHGDIRPGGLFLSRDGGVEWQNLGCPGAEIHAIAIDDEYLYCGARSLVGEAGLWRLSRSAVGI